jgi:hypothetical protein
MTGSDNVCNVNQTKDLRHSDSGITCLNLQVQGEGESPCFVSDDNPGGRPCRACGSLFLSPDRRRRFCSDACQQASFSASLRRRQAAHRQRHPDREVARQALKNAVLLGNVRRCTRCEDCGAKTFTEGHHSDYSRPLYVEWLCRECHPAADRARQHREAAAVKAGKSWARRHEAKVPPLTLARTSKKQCGKNVEEGR